MDGTALSMFLSSLSTDKMFVGLSMILMNVGSRYVVGDLTQAQQQLLTSEAVKQLIVFCMFFVPTRDVLVSMMLTFAFFFVTKNLLNEKANYNILTSEAFELDDGTDSYDIYLQATKAR